jgi:hypothetical protein
VKPFRKKGRSFKDRFLDFALPEPNSGCWLWIGGLYPSGYGSFDRRHAHRCSWELHHGEIPKGLLVCHKCDVRHCVNPEHLFVGTQSDNLNDMVAKGRNNNPHGESHAKARLTELQVAAIRCDARSLAAIGLDYGIDKQFVWKIKRGLYWKHSYDESAVDDAFARKRNGYKIRVRGEKHHKAVLTESDVRAIRLDARPSRVLGAIYGVSKTQILSIKNGKTWRHICA